MTTFKLGDFFTVKSHPFQSNYTDILIGGDAISTPPLMVISELCNSSDQHDTEDGSVEPNQVCGLYYLSKTDRYENRWFKTDEVKFFDSLLSDNKKFETEKLPLYEIKTKFRNRLGILRTVEIELEKKKISEERRGFGNLSLKRSAYLDFVPPVMTIIDVRIHEKIKDNFHKTTGHKKRVHSALELKCRYFNSKAGSFSEEWLPNDCVIDITDNFEVNDLMMLKGKCVYIPFKVPIALEESQLAQKGTVARIQEIVFQHYKYVLLGEDLLSSELLKIGPKEASTLLCIKMDDLFESLIRPTGSSYRLSESIFKVGNLYEISYVSEQGMGTTRTIMVTKKEKIGSGLKSDVIIVSNCLLRKGCVRHFKLSNIKSARKLKNDKKSLFVE